MEGANLYKRYLSGDDSALTELIRAYSGGLTDFLTGISGSEALAEELTEEVFFRLVTRRPRFRGEGAFRTWLYSIGRNLALDSLRRQKRLAPEPPEDHPELKAPESPEGDLLRQERALTVRRALANLSPDYRQALELIYFQGFTNEEAARIMRKTRRQMDNLLYRAKKTLAGRLEKEGITHEDL